MKTKHIIVTPRTAARMLEHNTCNRPVRPGHVKNLAAAMARGEWHETHQGIAFDINGNLIDGQHRLLAVAEQTNGFKLSMMITEGLPPDAFAYIDATQLKRSVSDSLRIDPRLGPVATFLYKLTHRSGGLVTAAMAEPYTHYAQPEFDLLLKGCAGTARYWSCAAVQSAAVMAMKTYGDPQYPIDMYTALVHHRQREMTPLVEAFHKSVTHLGNRYSPQGMFARCFYAFNEENSKASKLSIKNEDIYLAQAAAVIDATVPNPEATPIPEVETL